MSLDKIATTDKTLLNAVERLFDARRKRDAARRLLYRRKAEVHEALVNLRTVTTQEAKRNKESKMPPGPVSDAYDPEFSTASNAHDVANAIREAVTEIDKLLGRTLSNIVWVAQQENSPRLKIQLTERHLRVLRFAANRALESI